MKRNWRQPNWKELEADAVKYYGHSWLRKFAVMPTWTMDGWIWFRHYYWLPIVGARYAALKEKP